MEKNLDEFLELIKKGKISIREASVQSGYGRDYLRARLTERYGTDYKALKSLQTLMDDNKANSTRLEIDPNLLESVFLRTMTGEITLEQAIEEVGGIDVDTLKEKFLKFIQEKRPNEDLLLKYRQYKIKLNSSNPRKTDITKFNFRLLAIYMIQNGMSQTDLAKEIGVEPRTISREFEKFKRDEDQSLYAIVKFYSDKMIKRQKLTDAQQRMVDLGIHLYKQRNPELLSTKPKSQYEERVERSQRWIDESKKLKAEGLTQAEIAAKLGTSVSGLRRARIFLDEHTLLNNIPASSLVQSNIGKTQKTLENR